MKIVAIITEYNPFHNGHQYQINKIRELLGNDTAIVAIMSGNFTQRGEIAIADKGIRARAAVDCGVNLVLELPFPFSMSSAELFACAGVHIANEIGVIDYLAFGSETGDLDKLERVASNMSDVAYALRIKELSQDKRCAQVGYPEICEIAYTDLFSDDPGAEFFSPNNILALEYIKAIKRENSSITPFTIKREGASYNEEGIKDTTFQSATAIRRSVNHGDISALDFVPDNAKIAYSNAISSGMMPTDTSRLDAAIISHFRLNPPANTVEIHDAAGGLYNRLCHFSTEATGISSLTSMTETKKYTNARIRRAIWNSYLGVTSSDVMAYPSYTQLLAMDSVGRSILKRIKKISAFPIITKPSDYTKHSEAVIRQKELSNRADSIFALAHKIPISGGFALTFTPYVKK